MLAHDFLSKELKLRDMEEVSSASKNEEPSEEETKADSDAIITYEEHRYEGAADLMPVK